MICLFFFFWYSACHILIAKYITVMDAVSLGGTALQEELARIDYVLLYTQTLI